MLTSVNFEIKIIFLIFQPKHFCRGNSFEYQKLMFKLMNKNNIHNFTQENFVYQDQTVTQSALCDMYLKKKCFQVSK